MKIKYDFHSYSAQSFIELIGGLIIVIPIFLFLIDIAIIQTANVTNTDLCKRAARAAASVLNNLGQADGKTAMITAQEVISSFKQGSTIAAANLSYFEWKPDVGSAITGGADGLPPGSQPPDPGQLMVVTKMQVNVPIPFPGLPKTVTAIAQSIQPIVGLPPVVPPP